MKKKIIAMIPARLGSKRVKNKNLRKINGKMLVEYPIEAAKKSGMFDEIYLNSEALEFEEISKKHEIKFYRRSQELAQDDATNDGFMADFIENIECDIVIQLLPTSPFITSEIIKDFVTKMVSSGVQTLVSVKDVRIECFYKNRPINFNQMEITLPSQKLEPIQAYACGIMGWDALIYGHNMEKYGAAYHGGLGTIETYVLRGFSTVDIDEEEDFQLAEVVAKTIQESNIEEQNVETYVPSILSKDSIKDNNLFDANKSIININKIIESKSKDESWSHRIINSKTGSATLICQLPGEGNRAHYHDTVDEWWHIIKGTYEFLIDGEIIIANEGDVVFVERLKVHKITAIGNIPSIRFAVSHEDAKHIYID